VTIPRFTLIVLALSAPDVARACSVCTGQDDDSVNAAFLAGTLLLSVLPLAWIGGVAWWLARRARRLRDEAAAGVIRLPLPDARRDAPTRRRA
jgi:cbb3-type cytochrome oxidase subunit 3